MQLDPLIFAAIAGMALATYATRLAGFWLVSRTALRGRAAAALSAVPGSVLIALVAPMALATGPAETGAAVITILLAWRLPMVVAVGGGVAGVVALRLAVSAFAG